MLSLNPNVWEEKAKAGRARDCHLARCHLGEQQWQDGFGAPGKGFHAGAVGAEAAGTRGVQAFRGLQPALPAGTFMLRPAMTPTAFVPPVELFFKSIMHYP